MTNVRIFGVPPGDYVIVARFDASDLGSRDRARYVPTYYPGTPVASEAQRWAKMAPQSRPAVVNGVAGAVIGLPGRPFAVVAVTVANGRITAMDFVVDPAKLARISA